MRLGEALATCPGLVLVEQDPAGAEQRVGGGAAAARGRGLRGRARAELGCVYFETRGVERLYGGLEAALKRALAAVGTAWDPRAGAAERRFAALAAASVARPGQASDRLRRAHARSSSRRCRSGSLPLEPGRQRELKELGVRTSGRACRAPGRCRGRASGAGRSARLGPGEGRVARAGARAAPARRARGGARVPGGGRQRADAPARASTSLLERLLERPERAGRFARKVAVSARLVGGGSWRRTATLRDPTVELSRLQAALGPKLAELPAPILELRLELVELTEDAGRQLELVQPEGGELRGRLKEGLRQVRASTGSGSVCTVVEVAPWSRIPEARALFVPRDD